jgi:site-specific DNA-methyltransferase (adenine-specific)
MNTIDDVLSGRAKWCVVTGDCLDVLRTIPAGSVDAVVTDPPYSSGGMVRGDRMNKTSDKYRGWSQNEDGSSREPTAVYSDFTGDNRDQRSFLHWCALWWGVARQACAPGAIVLAATDWRQLPITTDAIQAGGFIWRGIVVWDKGVGRPMMGRFRNHVEYWCWGSHGPMRDPNEHKVYPSSVFRVTPPGHEDREHMTEKPVELMRGLMEIIPPDALVIDPFCGSGTTGVACMQTGRRFIGIEIDEGYATIARRRIAEATNHLFAGSNA